MSHNGLCTVITYLVSTQNNGTSGTLPNSHLHNSKNTFTSTHFIFYMLHLRHEVKMLSFLLKISNNHTLPIISVLKLTLSLYFYL